MQNDSSTTNVTNGEEAAALGDLVAQLAPVVAKSGFKTSEFWMLAAAMAGQLALAMGDHLPGTAAAALSMAGSAVYLFVRTAHKADAPERMQMLMGGKRL